MDEKYTPPQISKKRYSVHKLVLKAYHEQGALGWKYAIRGRISKKWIEAQELHLDIRKSCMNPQDHIVIRSLWKAMDYLWR